MHGKIKVKSVGPAFQSDKVEIHEVTRVWIIFTMVSGLFLGIAVLLLFVYQVSILIKNMTTVEEMILTSVNKPNPFFKGSVR